MKLTALAFTLAMLPLAASADQPAPAAAPTPVFDAALAREVGADKMGMRKYVMALLRSGPNRSKDPAERMTLQKAHMANIGRMADEGKLVLAGPFMDNGELRGIYIFNVETVEEAKKLTETDPLIQSGGLVMELHPWYGSAGIMKVTELHKRLQPPKAN